MRKQVLEYVKSHPILSLSLLITLLYIVFTICLGLYTKNVVPSNIAATANYPYEVTNSLNSFAKWDSRFYLSIAKYGYLESVHTAFFPLYPLLGSIVSYFVGSYLLGAALVSWASLVFAVYFYLKIVSRLFRLKKLEDYIIAACLFLFFPTAVFSVGVYTESLFAALALGAIYFALQKRPVWAVGFAAFACTTRLNGLFLLLFVLLLLLEAKYQLRKIIMYGLAGLIPLGMYMVFLMKEFGNPLQFLVAEKAWNRFGSNYFATLGDTVSAVSVLGFLLLMASVWYFVKRKRWSYVIYLMLYALTPLISGNFDGFSRYILMAFPLHWMVLEVLRRYKALYGPVLAVYAALWCYYLIQFVGGYTGG